MRKSIIALGTALVMGAFGALAATDAADMPIILTLKTNIYGYQGPDNSFTIYFGSLEKDTEFYVETSKTQEYVFVDPWNVGTDTDGDKTVLATAVPLSVTAENNTVTLRGDASQLDYIDVHGCYLADVEFNGDFTNLMVFDGSHNELTAIDLSGIPSLQSIDITDNAITVGTNMKIGQHPGLQLLQVGINDAVDPNLDLRNYPQLQYFSARNNYGLTHVDPTECPELVSLVLETTNVAELDVSKNPLLDVLNITQTRITDIDLSNNPALGEFYASHEGTFNSEAQYKLSSVDVSKNPNLQYLDLSGNRLTSLDLSGNPDLRLLYLQRNQLSTLDLSNCTKLATVNLSNNLFTFATLPLPQAGWDYTYYRQPLACGFKYRVGETLDFSSEVIRAPYVDAQGNTITPVTDARVLVLPRFGEGDVLDPESGIYTYADGKITFHQALADSVCIRFSNSVFNDWDLDTRSFMVKTDADYDLPTTAFSFTTYSSQNGKEVSFKMGAAPVAAGVSLPAQAMVSVGGETVATVDIATSAMPSSENITFTMPESGGKVTVYITDGFGVTNLAIDGVKISSIDLTAGIDIENLAITNANLPTVDLSFNRALRTLDLSGNYLTSIDFTPIRGDYEKWELRAINLANNRLSQISAANSEQFTALNLAGNRFTALDLKYFGGLVALDLSNNSLTDELDLTAQENLQELNASGNQLTSVVLANAAALASLDLSDNYLNFETLPLIRNASAMAYTYAPQKKMRILAGGASINLGSQNIGGATTYSWKYADNGEALGADLYTLEGGITKFSDELVGKTVYCEMTNPSFPAFATQPLTTTGLTVTTAPTNLVATLTPAESGPITIGFRFNTVGANAVYIDWNGDGSQYDEYIYDIANTAIYRPGTAYAGKTAKIYTYGNPEEVSMLFVNNPGSSQIKLTNLDASPMTKAEALDIHNAGLTDGALTLPKSALLRELVLDGSAFEAQVFTAFDGTTLPIETLQLSNNRYASFDISKYPQARYISLSDNDLTSVTGSSEALYQLDLQNNRLSSISLDGMSSLGELLLTANNLSEIDLSPVAQNLRALLIAGNRFTFATLPRYTDFNTDIFKKYDYFDQQPMEVACVDGRVDLSAQLEVEGVADDAPATFTTQYLWFLGNNNTDVYYDYYAEMFVGEQLEGPEQNPGDPEYTIDGGVTSFCYTQNRKVICAMTNEALPSLILYTVPVAIDRAGIEDVAADSASEAMVDVYTLTGVCLRRGVEASRAAEGLAPGIYVVGGQKIYVTE